MTANSEEQLLVSLLKASSRGSIEMTMILSENGTPVAYESDNKYYDPEYVATAAAVISGAVSSVMELLNAKGYKQVSVDLGDGRKLLIRQYKKQQKLYLVCLTNTNPNLGFIELLLEEHLPK
jgi:predicted regulator of Ras-like GTPase activity (Roadblock/LC7/MglB family)